MVDAALQVQIIEERETGKLSSRLRIFRLAPTENIGPSIVSAPVCVFAYATCVANCQWASASAPDRVPKRQGGVAIVHRDFREMLLHEFDAFGRGCHD